MQKFGMIVFVHNSGGVKDIVFNKVQKYENLAQLKFNFCKVLNNMKVRSRILKLNNQKLNKKYTNNFFYKSLKRNLPSK